MTLLTILAILVFTLTWLVAVAGVVLPVLPGVPIAAVGALLAAWMIGFERFGITALAYVGGLTVLALLLDVLGNWVGAKMYGASRAGLWGGILGSLVGIIVLPPFGFLLGALAGAAAFELLAGRNPNDALRAGIGAFLGALGGTVAKVVILVAIAVVVFPRFF